MVIIVMGVTASGKSTLMHALAERLGWSEVEADALHSKANIAKMAQGIPLVDADRWPWLDAVAHEISRRAGDGESLVVSCSALKRAYRRVIVGDRPDVALVYLKGSRELIGARMAARQHHFMPPALLDSQFATLEEPPDAITVDVGRTPKELVAEIIRALNTD